MTTTAIRTMIAATLCFGLSAPALADSPSGKQPAESSSGKDPSEIVCEKIKLSGSRIAAKRICQTRAQWDIQRQEDRQAIEQGQTRGGSCEGC